MATQDERGPEKSNHPPMPDVGQMARRAAGRKEHHVDSHIVGRLHVGRLQDFGGGDAGEAAFVDREVELGSGRAGLHLHEGDHGAAPGDQVDFAERRADAAGEYFPALQPQSPGADALCLTAALLGL